MRFRNIMGVLGMMFFVLLMSDITGYADYTQDFTNLTDADLKRGLFEQNVATGANELTVEEDVNQNKYASIKTGFNRGVVWKAHFPKPEMGETLEISFKYMYNAKAEVYSYKSLYFLGYDKNNAKVQKEILTFPSSKNRFATVRNGITAENIGAAFGANKWNDIKITVNTYSQWADLYINNVKTAHFYIDGDEADFVGRGITGIAFSNNAMITLDVSANYNTKPGICIDDIVVKNLSKNKLESNKAILYDNSFSKYNQGEITELKDIDVEIDNVFSIKNSGGSTAGIFILPDKSADISPGDNKCLYLEGKNGTSAAEFKVLSNNGDTVELDFDFLPRPAASGEISVAFSGETLFSVNRASLTVSELAYEGISDSWNKCKIVIKKMGADMVLADVYINNACYIKDKSLANTDALSILADDLQERSSVYIDNLRITEGAYDTAFVSVSIDNRVVEGRVDENMVVLTPLCGVRGRDCVVTVKIPDGILDEYMGDAEKIRCFFAFYNDRRLGSFYINEVDNFRQTSNTFSFDVSVPENAQHMKVMLLHMDGIIPLMQFKMYN